MDYTEYTTTELVSISGAYDQLLAILEDTNLPADFPTLASSFIAMSETERYEEVAEVTRAANILVYAEGVDNPLDLVTPILTDEQAAEHPDLYPAWAAGIAYAMGVRIQHGGKLWKCLQAHTSQAGWEPGAAPSLWVEVAKPGEIPVWKQPTGTADAYSKGDKVRYPDENGKVYESTIDGNVWSPEAYPQGWTEEA